MPPPSAGIATLATVAQTSSAQTSPSAPVHKGRLKQSVMRLDFDPQMPFEDMCREAARLGAYGMDLIGPNDWPMLKKYGLIPTMAGAGRVTMTDGVIRKELHDKMEQPMHDAIDQCAAGGCPSLITVGGQRKGIALEDGAENAAAFFNRVKAHAEDKGVTICMEIMNKFRPTPGHDPLASLRQAFDILAV